MANPFYIEPANPLSALMLGVQGYDKSRKSAEDAELKSVYRDIGQEIQTTGKISDSVLGRIMGLGPSGAPLVAAAAALRKAGAEGAESAGVYGTPIYGTDAEGKTVLGAIGKRGDFRRLDTGGVTPTPGAQFLDTGTGYIPMNRRSGQPMGAPVGGAVPGAGGAPAPQVPGQPPGYIPKDVKGEAQQKRLGTEIGEAQASLTGMQAKLPSLMESVKQLEKLGDEATYTVAGQTLDSARRQLNIDPRESAIARVKYIAMVDNQILPLLRETFGAQFTQKEGESLKITLGDPDKSPKEKRAVLDAFIAQKVRNIAATERQVGQSRNLTGPGKTITGVEVTPVPNGVVDWRTYFGGQK